MLFLEGPSPLKIGLSEMCALPSVLQAERSVFFVTSLPEGVVLVSEILNANLSDRKKKIETYKLSPTMIYLG